MKAVAYVALLGVVSLAGCRHAVRVASAPPPSVELLADATFVQSVIKTLPAYIADEQNARFEVDEIWQVEMDLKALDAMAPDFHQQVKRLSADVDKLVAKNKFLETKRLA